MKIIAILTKEEQAKYLNEAWSKETNPATQIGELKRNFVFCALNVREGVSEIVFRQEKPEDKCA